ncbi:MAG: SRPBCC family protein [Nannocystaceae bacterium]
MTIVEATRRIRAPAAQLFALSQDYTLRTEWDPFTGRMAFQDGATETKPGTKVTFTSRQGLTMEVEFVTVRPPRTVAMKMIRGPWFFARFAGSWTFDEGDGVTDVTFRYSFRARPAALAWALAPIFRRELRMRLEGMRRAAEESDLLTRLAA